MYLLDNIKISLEFNATRDQKFLSCNTFINNFKNNMETDKVKPYFCQNIEKLYILQIAYDQC